MNRGNKVKVYNTTPSGKTFCEGTATCCYRPSPLTQPDTWLVQFPDGSKVLRVVLDENLVGAQ